MRKFITFASAAAMLAPVFVATATPAEARHRAREWQGTDGRTYCRKSDGTTGLVIGAAAGGLLGRAVDSSGSRATGTIVGLAAGGLLGRHIERNRRCR